MLADMGIEVWLLRDPPVQDPAALASRPGGLGATIGPTTSTTTLSTSVGSMPAIAPETAGHPLAVICLVSQNTVLLVDDAGTGVSGERLCRDLLASVTGHWRPRPREITFTWPAGRSQAECWRAFKAFAEKQLGELDVAVVLCSEGLLGQLPELGVDCKLLALPGLSELGVEAKRVLWRRMQALNT